ncbi:MAG: DUF4276 family protein [Burkholderiales bacterium]|jgi:hypothetical protein|nr:DUF4276 family protein [Burkholderiales bacterium]
MRHLVFLLEGPSEKEALEAWVPTLLPPGVQSHFIVFEGKQDMERRMALKLRHWMQPDSRFIVLRDQDSADCTDVKAALLARCTESGRAADCIVRIACHELESFFLGDWQAVAQAFSLPRLADLDRKAIYRDPDRIALPEAELRRHVPGYQKRGGARRIAPLMDLERNRSRSFVKLREAITRQAQP